MEKIDTTKFKKLLEAELKRLDGELKTVGHKSAQNPDDWEALPAKLEADTADDLEVAESIDEYEENTAILKQLEIQYNDVKKALEKIKNGTYGLCEVDNHPIEIKRLEANPAARTCLAHTKHK